MEKRQNLIQLEKDVWFQDCNVLFNVNDIQTVQNYKDLKVLKLVGHVTFKENSFDNLKKLKKLSLAGGWAFLKSNTFAGLDNLESLNLFNLYVKFENLFNLKTLTLENLCFEKEFSFENFKNLETLFLQYPHFYYKTPDNFLSYLTNLKNLFYYPRRHEVDLSLIIKLFSNLPNNVEKFVSFDYILDIFHSNKTPFIYNLKSLVITIESEIDFKNYFLFHENLFPCLESIDLRLKPLPAYLLERKDISIELFKKIKTLKVLKLKGLRLIGIDRQLRRKRVFNYLEEASFDFEIPANILNFSNLKKLNLENFKEKIELREDFLEDLINLEELVLDNVISSIETNVQYLFKKLIKLKELNLTCVRFRNLRSTYFDYLVNLEKLDLQDSNFEIIEESPFRNLKNLNYLNLVNCKADKPFDRSFFVGILNLNTLSYISSKLKKNFLSELNNLD